MRVSVGRAAVAVCVVLAAGACSSSTSTKSSPATSGSTSSTVAQKAAGAGRPYPFTFRREVFTDTTRATASPGDPAYSPNRVLPTDLYLPTSPTPRPLIMFSHGYHGAPRKFSQLFTAWARAGYIVAAPRFPLTSDRGAPFDSVGDLANQPADISFVLTELLHGPLRS